MNSPVMSLQEVQDMMGCGRTKVFELLANGTLEQAPRYGRNIRIYRDTVLKALERTRRRTRRAQPSPAGFSLEDLPAWGER